VVIYITSHWFGGNYMAEPFINSTFAHRYPSA
jgi:hypothetical protein